jgi:hypothetical protein
MKSKIVVFLALYFLVCGLLAQESENQKPWRYDLKKDACMTLFAGVQFQEAYPIYPNVAFFFEDRTGLYEMSGNFSYQTALMKQGSIGLGGLYGHWDFRFAMSFFGFRNSPGLSGRAINIEIRRRVPLIKSQRLLLSSGLRLGINDLDYMMAEQNKDENTSYMVLEDGRFPNYSVGGVPGTYTLNLEGTYFQVSPVIGINYLIPKTGLIIFADVSYDLAQFQSKTKYEVSVTFIDGDNSFSNANRRGDDFYLTSTVSSEFAEVTYQDRPISRFPIRMDLFLFQIGMQVRLN